METVLIVAYLLIVIAMIAVILLQRSEGGGLGMGSSNPNGLVTARGSGNVLTRTTAILGTLFFVTAIALTILAELDRGTESILQRATEGADAPTTVLDALQQMQGDTPATTTETPATTTAPAATTTAPAATTEPAAPAAPVEAAPAPADPGLAVPTTPTTPAAPAN
jgi:preprotein translocase subunit SecG